MYAHDYQMVISKREKFNEALSYLRTGKTSLILRKWMLLFLETRHY